MLPTSMIGRCSSRTTRPISCRDSQFTILELILPCLTCRAFHSNHQMTLATNQSIRWFVQPVNDEMLGPRSTSSVFHIPHDIGNEINSTWGYINVSEGGFLPDLNEPSGFVVDTTLDSAAQTANLYNSGTISVGRSYSSGSSQRSSSIVSVDLTKLPINGTYEIMDAYFTLNTKSTSYGEVWLDSVFDQHRFRW